MANELSGRHVVVTGARGGLGPAVVAALRAAGAELHLPQRGPGGASEPGLTVTGGIDLGDEIAVRAYYAGLPGLWASLHLAGGYAGAAITETALADLRGQIDINLTTAFLCCREAVRVMRAKGGGGRIVNVASRAALVPGGGALAYASAKAAVVALTQGLAVETRDDGILVNAIAPGTIDTPKNREAMAKADTRRWTSPAAIAEALLFLVAPTNQVVTGTVVPV